MVFVWLLWVNRLHVCFSSAVFPAVFGLKNERLLRVSELLQTDAPDKTHQYRRSLRNVFADARERTYRTNSARVRLP